MKLWARATIALLLIFVVGCGEDTEVRTYTVAKRPAPPTATDEAPTPVQTIGVIYPHKSTAWFLKLMDDPSKVESLSSEFRRLADSIQFGEDGSPQWKLTEGWKDQQSLREQNVWRLSQTTLKITPVSTASKFATPRRR